MTSFGPPEIEPAPLDTAAVAIWPVPYERTTSYGRGTARGPAGILAASDQLEVWDERTRRVIGGSGVATLPAFDAGRRESIEATLERLGARAGEVARPGQRLVALGGEHGLTPALVAAVAAAHGEIGVVQFDAHADLRESFEGTRWSHACAMARVRELGVPTLSLGVRALSEPEDGVLAAAGAPVVWGWELAGLDGARFAELLKNLPERVYLTFDLDYFDPAVLPATGTPEPGGGAWWPTLDLLEVLFREKDVVAADCVELAPIPGQPASDFLAARLVWKWVEMWERGED